MMQTPARQLDHETRHLEFGHMVWFDPKRRCGVIAREAGGEAFVPPDQGFALEGHDFGQGQRLGFRSMTCDRLGRVVAVEITAAS